MDAAMQWLYRELRKFKSARDAHNIARRMVNGFTGGNFAALQSYASQCPQDWEYILKTARVDYSAK